MVHRKVIGNNRNISEELNPSKSLKRKQQKFEQKLSFYSQVKDVSSLSAKNDIKKKRHRSGRKKLKAYDLSSLAEFLPDLKNVKPPADATRSKLKKQKLVEKEGMHLKTVLSHPTFQLDPLNAIHQHIMNTQIACQDKAVKPKLKKSKTCRKSRRKGQGEASSNIHSMDASA